MLNGKYSNFEGIDFNQKELMWSIAVNGIVIGYSIAILGLITFLCVLLPILLELIVFLHHLQHKL